MKIIHTNVSHHNVFTVTQNSETSSSFRQVKNSNFKKFSEKFENIVFRMPHQNGEFMIYEITNRYINHAILQHGFRFWPRCPNLPDETDIERELLKRATEYEQSHYKDLMKMAWWLLVNKDDVYPIIKERILVESVLLNKDTPVDLDTVLVLLAWGGLQAVRAIARNTLMKGGELAMLISNFTALMIEESGIIPVLRESGGWVRKKTH